MRPLAMLHAVTASLLVASLAIQVFLAGLGVFDDPSFFLTHRDSGYALELLALVVLVVGAIARAGRRQVGVAGLMVLLFVLQSVFVGLRTSAPAVAALHPVNGFVIVLLSIVLARDAWALARSRSTAASTSGSVAAPG
ncbi:MAG: DUF6220 domain-containing protein [Candidatus Limnocylindrales bacterium]